MLFDINTSTTDAIQSTIAISPQNIVCLIISIFIFSLLLSFTIDLYSLKPLTLIAIIAGINIMFCKIKLLNIKASPFDVPSTLIHAEIVYPRQKPLYITRPKTAGIPYNRSSKKP